MLPRSALPLSFSLLLFSSFTTVHAAGALLKIDTIAPNELTLVLKDFNDPAASHASITANTPTPAPTWTGTSNGYHSYTVPTATNDGKVAFNTVPYDVQYYTTVRVRQRSSINGGSTEMWPNVPQTATSVVLGNTSTSYTEVNRYWSNPTNPAINTATNGGFRFDPNTFTSEITYDLDYVMVDYGRVVGFEFDVGESGLTSYQGWNNANTRFNNLLSSGGTLKGTTNHNDAYLQNSSLSLNTAIYKFAEIRMKAEADAAYQFFWTTSNSTSFSEDKSVRSRTVDGEWHIYLVDLSAETLWTGNLTGFRVDIGDGNGTTGVSGIDFEIDYIRFREFGAAPEPTRAALLITALTCISLIRRRRTI